MDTAQKDPKLPDFSYLKKPLLFSLLLLVVLAVYLYLSSPLEITVFGTGEVDVPATSATISLTVSEMADDPMTAAGNLKTKVGKIKAVLLQNGVKEEDIVEAQPRILPAVLASPGSSGYQASQTIGGKTNQVEITSTLTALLYDQGASLVSQPVLSIEDQSQWEEKAVEQAFRDAKDRANQLAKKYRKLFKKIVFITQSQSPTTGTVTSRGQITEESASLDTLKITSVVSVTYRMW